MEPVGGQMGQVHSERQGTGRATILQGNEAVDAYGRIWQVSAAKRAAADAAAKEKKAAALAKLTAFQPEYFYKDKGKLQPLIEAHIASGAKFLAGNKDPWTSGDPEATAWQKEHQRLTALSALSMQKKKEYEAFRADIDGKDPGEFMAGDIEATNAWFDTDIEKMPETGSTRPQLRKLKAWEDASAFIGQGMRTWTSAKPNPSDTEINDFVTASITEPANQKYVAAYSQKLSTSTPEEQARINEAAKAANRQPVQQMAFEDAKRWMKGQEPLDMLKEMELAAKAAEGRMDWTQGSNDIASYRFPVKGTDIAAAKTVARDMFNSREDWLTIYDKNGELPRGKEEETGAYAARVQEKMAADVLKRMSIERKYDKKDDGSGGAGRRLIETRDEFIKDMRSGDVIAANAASKLLTGSTFANNLKVSKAVVNTAPNNHQFLRLDLSTGLSLKEVKQSIVDSNTGVESDSVTVEEREGTRIAIIDLGAGDIANQTLGRIYDNYHKETGSYYDPKLTERSIKTAAGVVASKPTEATPVVKSVPSLDNIFKK